MSNNSLHSDSHPNKPTYELTSIKQNITTSHSVLRIILLKKLSSTTPCYNFIARYFKELYLLET